jgi:hypothetical protein
VASSAADVTFEVTAVVTDKFCPVGSDADLSMFRMRPLPPSSD